MSVATATEIIIPGLLTTIDENTFINWTRSGREITGFFLFIILIVLKKDKLFKDTFVYHWPFLITRVTVKTFKRHLESSIYSAEN